MLLWMLCFVVALVLNLVVGVSEDAASNVAMIGGLPLAPILVFNYVMRYIWIITVVLFFPFLVLEKSLAALNFIGKGRALSGIGILAALWALLESLKIVG